MNLALFQEITMTKRMRPEALAWAAVALLIAIQGCGLAGSGANAAAVNLESEEDKTLYALGLSMGGNLSGLDLDAREIGLVSAGLADAASGTEPKVDLQVYGPKISELAQSRTAKAAQAEKEGARAFMEETAREKGAVASPSGLVYIETQAGTGASPTAQDTVRVHYRGMLTDGNEFDSSYKRNEPVEFPLQGVIPCWTEGVQKMKVGGKAKLVCPPAIAYGDAGRPPVIPPGATLVFEVELLDVVGR